MHLPKAFSSPRVAQILIVGALAFASITAASAAQPNPREIIAPARTCDGGVQFIGIESPPDVIAMHVCDLLSVEFNVSGIRPVEREPNPTATAVDGSESTLGPVLSADYRAQILDMGHTVVLARFQALRAGSAEITFYKADGSVRAVTTVSVVP